MSGKPVRALVALGLLAAPAGAGDWPQWRGPSRSGVSPEKNLPVRWSADDNVAWKLALPSGSGSTPIVSGDRIFLNVADGEDLFLWCVDRKRGTVVWRSRLGGGNVTTRKQNMSSPSPVTDGRRVFVMTGTGVVKGFERDGREVWARDLQKEYGPFGLNWGYASSPLLHGDALFVQVLHGMKTDDPSYVLALDTATGKNRWRVERPTEAVRESPDAYTTPAVVERGTHTEIVVSGADVVTGHDAATGRELWRAAGLNPGHDSSYRIVASPVVAGDIVYVPSRVRPLLALRAGGRGDVSRSHRLWSFDNGPDVPTPATDGTHLYIVNDKGLLWCLHARSGQPAYGPQRLRPGTYSASPVLADGKLYATSEDGLTSVVEAGAAFALLAENALDDYTLSSPAISDGQLFIRTAHHLYCIGPPRGR